MWHAFSLDFNLRSHIKTHSLANYHICPFPECGKRYAHEYKLKNHVMSRHKKNVVDVPKYVPPLPEKTVKAVKASTTTHGSGSADRLYSCPYEGCEKAYIHEYKLNLHLRREHPGHFPEENAKNAQSNADNEMDEGSDQDAYAKKLGSTKAHKQSRPKPSIKLPPSKVPHLKGTSAAPSNMNVNLVKKTWSMKEKIYEEEDSEETEEDRDDDEQTEYED